MVLWMFQRFLRGYRCFFRAVSKVLVGISGASEIMQVLEEVSKLFEEF